MESEPVLTFIISICISRMVALSWGSLISWLLTFMISVDFWKAPVTLTMATRLALRSAWHTPWYQHA